MRDFDEADSAFHQTAAEQATLAAFATITTPQLRWLMVQMKSRIELGTAQLQALLSGRLVIDQPGIVGGVGVVSQRG